MLTCALFILLSQTPAHHSSLPVCLSVCLSVCLCVTLSSYSSYPGHRSDQRLRHIQALPAAGAARGPHPLLRLGPVQQRLLPAARRAALHQRGVHPPDAEDVVIWERAGAKHVWTMGIAFCISISYCWHVRLDTADSEWCCWRTHVRSHYSICQHLKKNLQNPAK